MSNRPKAPLTADVIADRMAIVDTLHQHCRGLDRNDAELLKDCYWPEGSVDYGNFKGPAHTFTELVGPALSQIYELTRHSISNTLLEFDGSLARAESYVQAGHLLTGGKQEMRFEGRYLDTLEKRDTQWRLIHRQVVMDWSCNSSITDERESEAYTALAKGKADKTDPLYPFLAGSVSHD